MAEIIRLRNKHYIKDVFFFPSWESDHPRAGVGRIETAPDLTAQSLHAPRTCPGPPPTPEHREGGQGHPVAVRALAPVQGSRLHLEPASRARCVALAQGAPGWAWQLHLTSLPCCEHVASRTDVWHCPRMEP